MATIDWNEPRFHDVGGFNGWNELGVLDVYESNYVVIRCSSTMASRLSRFLQILPIDYHSSPISMDNWWLDFIHCVWISVIRFVWFVYVIGHKHNTIQSHTIVNGCSQIDMVMG
jgi:hypothetical protein